MEDEKEPTGTLSERLEELKELFIKEEISAEEYSILKNNLEKKFLEQEVEETEEEKPKSSKKNKSKEEDAKEGTSTENRIGWMVLAGIIIAVLLYSIVAAGGTSSSFTGFAGSSDQSANNQYNGDAQVVKMHVEGLNYILEPATFKVGVPVRIEADMSKMPGCAKSISISGFGIRKSLSSSDNAIEFTPTKAGKFNIACSMNMYMGTFVVLQADGSKANYVEATPTGGHTCGAGGGGCGGCGG